MTTAPVFKKTYQTYVQQIARLDLTDLAPKLGLQRQADGYGVQLIDRNCWIGGQGIYDHRDQVPDLATCVIIANYLLRCPPSMPLDNALCAYRDFKDAGPLLTYFDANGQRPICDRFRGRMAELAKQCRRIGGETYRTDLGYDLKYRFHALPQIPVYLLFNDADDTFPAQCQLLFQRSAETYLDMESLGMLGVMLAQMLVRSPRA